ncbi:MAG: hypothetical protein KF858_04125 [Candidatus Sumerlaeia bacterium]|nr:hypothetical protein [Candidatus Sumerlaeia bacterium]
MRYIINVEECDLPDTVRYWATVEGLEGCNLAEDTIEELFRNAPGIIRDFIELSNRDGSNNFPTPTEFEFRHLVHS